MRRTASSYTKWYHGPYDPRQQSYNDHQAGFIPNRQTVSRKVVHTKQTCAVFATFQLFSAFLMRNITKILLMTENWKFLSKKLKKWKNREPKKRLLRVQTIAEPLFYWLSDGLTWSDQNYILYRWHFAHHLFVGIRSQLTVLYHDYRIIS